MAWRRQSRGNVARRCISGVSGRPAALANGPAEAEQGPLRNDIQQQTKRHDDAARHYN